MFKETLEYKGETVFRFKKLSIEDEQEEDNNELTPVRFVSE